jgi:hypothetical protein
MVDAGMPLASDIIHLFGTCGHGLAMADRTFMADVMKAA